jgi:multiple sugar transport system substrate-binding protein
MLGGWNLMVPTNSAKKKATVDFIKFLLSRSSQEIFYSKGSYYPVITAFYEDSSYLVQYPEISEMKRLMSTGVHRPLERDYTKYSEIMAHYISLAIRNRVPIDSALAGMTGAIKAERAAAGAR